MLVRRSNELSVRTGRQTRRGHAVIHDSFHVTLTNTAVSCTPRNMHGTLERTTSVYCSACYSGGSQDGPDDCWTAERQFLAEPTAPKTPPTFSSARPQPGVGATWSNRCLQLTFHENKTSTHAMMIDRFASLTHRCILFLLEHALLNSIHDASSGKAQPPAGRPSPSHRRSMSSQLMPSFAASSHASAMTRSCAPHPTWRPAEATATGATRVREIRPIKKAHTSQSTKSLGFNQACPLRYLIPATGAPALSRITSDSPTGICPPPQKK